MGILIKPETTGLRRHAYNTSASFVPKLTHRLLELLDPQPTDDVLDIGCGDGKFTSSFIPQVKSVLGLDSSPSMIDSARKDHGGLTVDFQVRDCRYLEDNEAVVNAQWDKVAKWLLRRKWALEFRADEVVKMYKSISNAALHWILKEPSTRLNVFKAAYAALKPGGTFVFEMGGHGNVAEVHTALLAAVTRQGATMEQAHAASPWFFPSESWMRTMLEKVGFEVRTLEIEYRPTKLTTVKDGGIEGWVRLMASPMLDILDANSRDAAVAEACELLETIITREEDGSKWLGYVRLRGVAAKMSE
ncbi:hypothetical protein AJ79_02249 [Helicocarpus griseus UAMH5409]|uniref:Methyltransferase domain-containing protein n=1 Tax=Helicocarpus griseus UAMH5409 TaxID=1447875 RepID=A0A2B7Y374_9EURO|nr:hypothetical protein AJ79_02249 [Helicocarpus griseus UAMH5409]